MEPHDPFLQHPLHDRTFTKSGVGLFWHMKKGVQGWLAGGDQQVDTFWMFESGMVDLFVMLGPGPKAVSRQDGLLTCNTPLPPEFSIAYHQCVQVW